MSYDFSIKIARNADSQICVDPSAKYGYWERKDGSEGGGLWFAALPDGKLELVDYDGAFELPKEVIGKLRENGFVLDEVFDH